ncbi:MAG TPA: metal ABC transporter permease [Solirubrobacteraceae bacterium]|jgi:zinc/manganese transport system permease protein
MLSVEFMRNALLAGSFIALACGLCGWFVVLRGQVFAGDALSHVAFPGALAAAAAGADERVGLFAATVLVGGAIGMLGRGALASGGGGGGARNFMAGEDTSIGIVFTFVLALGVYFLTRFSLSSNGSAGVETARTLFGSIFGLSGSEALLAALLAAGASLGTLVLARPLLFASVSPELARARGVSTRLLGIAFLALLGVVAAEASQAVGALLLLGLLTGPAAAAHRLSASPAAGLGLAGALALLTMWAGLVLAYLIGSLPPSSAIVGVSLAVYLLSGLRR